MLIRLIGLSGRTAGTSRVHAERARERERMGIAFLTLIHIVDLWALVTTAPSPTPATLHGHNNATTRLEWRRHLLLSNLVSQALTAAGPPWQAFHSVSLTPARLSKLNFVYAASQLPTAFWCSSKSKILHTSTVATVQIGSTVFLGLVYFHPKSKNFLRFLITSNL